jgi:hypothetical protein
MVNAPAGANALAAFPNADPHSRLTMSFAARTVWVTLSAGITVAALWAASMIRPVADVTLKAEPPPVDAHPAGIKGLAVGTAGCLGAACHGAPARDALAGKIDDATWQSSGNCWCAADPHSAAYSLLTDRPNRPVKVTAKWIMARYAKGAPATEDARCLACHTNPALVVPDKDGSGRTEDPRLLSLRAEGVSCEACHGNAGGWLRQHTTWTGKRDDVYAQTGMVKLYDVTERAVACLGCHVGQPADPDRGLPVRDMNHDMIAAGHPRLNFDFAEYLRRLPPHWQEKERTEKGNIPRGPGFPAKAWLAGRVAHAEAACRLLESRAARSKDDKRTPWPEYAEYNCASCHHDLPAEWRGEVLEGRALGAPVWQTVWPVLPAIGLSPQRSIALGEQNSKPDPVPVLVRAMQTGRPVAADVRPLAATAASELKKYRVGLDKMSDAQALDMMGNVFVHFELRAPDWDSALQTLFGLAALERSIPNKRRDPQREKLFREAFDAYRRTDLPEADRWPEIRGAVQTLLPSKKK